MPCGLTTENKLVLLAFFLKLCGNEQFVYDLERLHTNRGHKQVQSSLTLAPTRNSIWSQLWLSQL